MRKLIEIKQVNLIECDNPRCNFVVPNEDNDVSPEAGKEWVNVSCPNCGRNLLTQQDYEQSRKMLKMVHWVNKWFSWLRFFSSKEELAEVEVKVHNGLKSKRVK